MSGIRRSISEVTDFVNSLAKDTEDQLNNLSKELGNIKDLLSVIVQAVGEDAIKAKMNEMLQNRLKAEEEAHAQAIEALKGRGILTDAESATGDVLVSGREDFADGRVRQVRFELKRLAPEGAAQFEGKKVGDAVADATTGSTMTITGIYSLNREAAAQHIMAEEEAATATVQ